MKKSLIIILIIALMFCFISCSKKQNLELSETDKIIIQAQNMSLEELCRKAIEESNGKTFFGLGNSSRGKSALPLFIEYCKTLVPSYDMKYEWQQPKNNKIFEQLQADGEKKVGTFAMTLIQDGNQIETKLAAPGVLKTFIPKEWVTDNNINIKDYKGYLPLQTLNKVFMFNNTGNRQFKNVWDFVLDGNHTLFMDVDSEVIGKNFLYMLTEDKYATFMKEAFDTLDTAHKTQVQKVVDSLQKTASDMGFKGNSVYSLAWIKMFVESYNEQTDDGPICNTLVKNSATDQSGLIVYSKLRSVEESRDVSANNITIAAYQDDYKGVGGYAYCHYLFLTDNTPLPWTACAFIAYMTCTVDGFSAWGKDMGGYSGNARVMRENEERFHHTRAGYVNNVNKFPAKNDRGYEWWKEVGKLVIEDPEYCSKCSFVIGPWIDSLKKFN